MLDLLLYGKKFFQSLYIKYDHKHVQGQKKLTFLAKNLPKLKYYFHFNI